MNIWGSLFSDYRTRVLQKAGKPLRPGEPEPFSASELVEEGDGALGSRIPKREAWAPMHL